MSNALAYLWPHACPRCNAEMGVLDRIVLQFRRLAGLATLFKGRLPSGNRDLRKCDWCHKPTGARKVAR